MEKLKLFDLIMKSTANEGYCLAAAQEVFQRRYNATVFIITGPFTDDEEYAVSEDVVHLTAYLRNLKLIGDFLESFGHFTHHIEIFFKQIQVADGKQVITDINDKSHESLYVLKLEDCKGNMLDDLKNTFTNVERLIFSSSSSQKLVVGQDAITFNLIFPKVSSLSIGYTRASDWTLIGQEFPYLNYFYVDLPKVGVEELPNSTCVENVIDKSPAVEKLSIKHSSLSFLKELNRMLPGLKSLELRLLSIDYFNYNASQPKIHFENVVSLAIQKDCQSDRVPEHIAFPEVEDVQLQIQPEFSDKWIHFIGEQLNLNISNLDISTSILSDENFLMIPEKFYNLNTVTISCGTEFKANQIVDFLQLTSSLKRMIIKIPMLTAEQIILKAELRNKWKCDIHPFGNRVMVTLER